jgi:hypothetical protein
MDDAVHPAQARHIANRLPENGHDAKCHFIVRIIRLVDEADGLPRCAALDRSLIE